MITLNVPVAVAGIQKDAHPVVMRVPRIVIIIKSVMEKRVIKLVHQIVTIMGLHIVVMVYVIQQKLHLLVAKIVADQQRVILTRYVSPEKVLVPVHQIVLEREHPAPLR